MSDGASDDAHSHAPARANLPRKRLSAIQRRQPALDASLRDRHGSIRRPTPTCARGRRQRARDALALP
jgi:hypothetical protein